MHLLQTEEQIPPPPPVVAEASLPRDILEKIPAQEKFNQEVASLVTSADSMYQVLQELAEWVENDTTGSAKLISDVATLNENVDELSSSVINNAEKVDELSGSVIGNAEKINELSAETESLKSLVENIPIPSGSPVDESVIQALKDYIDEKIAAIKYESDHVFISRTQYYDLIANGSVVIDGKVHEYSDDIYYCIYDEVMPPSSGEPSYDYDEETGLVEISGNTEVTDGIAELSGAEIDEDGFVTISDVEPTPSEPEIDSDGLLSVTSLPLDENGLIEGATLDEDGFIEIHTN